MLIILMIVIASILFLMHPLFGKNPNGLRLKRMQLSPNYSNKQFQNLVPTPQLTEGYSMGKVMWNFLFNKTNNNKPQKDIPTVPIDFHTINYKEDAYYWFGHSSYILIVDGKLFLIDPVFSENASPIYGSNRAFNGTNFINIDALPTIDYLIITHDHYDHLDYSTIKKIKPKVQQVICGLGVGSHFEFWGYDASKVKELDWWQDIHLHNHLKITATPARHFSGRTFFHKNNTLYCSYMLETASKHIFIGGDSGYGPHFKLIGQKFPTIDYAFLEYGQYNKAWHYIHLHPEELEQVIEDIQPRVIVPVHHSKFALSTHDWREPLRNVIRYRTNTLAVETPLIGQRVALDYKHKEWQNWWEEI